MPHHPGPRRGLPHGPALRADAAIPRPQPVPFSLLRQGVGPRLAVAALVAGSLWGLIGWATA
ncbi:hypothetical protein [Methylobacterium tarhaniae]|nr:hypothetical protein [Methylobacterium tarhaniae]